MHSEHAVFTGNKFYQKDVIKDSIVSSFYVSFLSFLSVFLSFPVDVPKYGK